MAHRGEDSADRWARRAVPDHLARRYVNEGWWTTDTLGSMVEEGLRAKPGTAFTVCSRVRPWRGTVADVDRAARSLAGSLRARGVG
ncbi:MAG: hypothetical protein ACRDZR_18290, partial [Acidimicrobiales bacterium]